jgi:hypothetical protein
MSEALIDARQSQFRQLEQENEELRRVLGSYEADMTLLNGPFSDASDHIGRTVYGRVMLVHPTWSQDCGRATLIVVAAQDVGRVVVIRDRTDKVIGERCMVASKPVGGGDVSWFWALS